MKVSKEVSQEKKHIYHIKMYTYNIVCMCVYISVCIWTHINDVRIWINDVMRSLGKPVTDQGRAAYAMRVMDWWAQ